MQRSTDAAVPLLAAAILTPDGGRQQPEAKARELAGRMVFASALLAGEGPTVAIIERRGRTWHRLAARLVAELRARGFSPVLVPASGPVGAVVALGRGGQELARRVGAASQASDGWYRFYGWRLSEHLALRGRVVATDYDFLALSLAEAGIYAAQI